jgi:hypothetical protein
LIFILSIFLAPRLPLQDFADWVYQSKAFYEILQSNPEFTNALSLRPPVVPNSAVTIIMGFLNFIFPPDISGRILVVATLLVSFTALRKMFKIGQVTDLTAESLALLFAPSIFFFYGLISYNLGLGLFLLIALFPLASSNQNRGILIYSMLFLILYYIHFIILFMAVYVIAFSRVILKNKSYISLPRMTISLIPVFILYIFYFFGPSTELHAETIWKYNIFGKLVGYFQAMSVIYRFNDFISIRGLLIIIGLNLIFIVGLILFIYSNIRGRFRSFLFHKFSLIGFSFWMIALITPFQIAGFGYKGDRFFWIGFIFFFSAMLAESMQFTRYREKLISAVIIIIMIARSISIIVQGVNDHNLEKRLISAIPPKTRFIPLMVKFDFPEYYPPNGNFENLLLKTCPGIITFHRVPYYLFLDRNQNLKGIFKTGIIRPQHYECNPKLIIQGSEEPTNEECSNLLFVSPGGIGDNLISLAQSNFSHIVHEKDFLFVSKPKHAGK